MSVAPTAAAISVASSPCKANRIGHVAIVIFRPKMAIGTRVDQLHRHAHMVSGPTDAAFDYVAHAELLRDLLEIAPQCRSYTASPMCG